MRQAGRYLPEYRELRARAKSFLMLCYTPDLAAEVTLQPLKRFDMSAAIIFSDILVVPHAMGVHVEFVTGEGPRLSPVTDAKAIAHLKNDVRGHLMPVGQAIQQVRARMKKEKSLIGFCGAPWTVACYMIEGKNVGDHWQETRKFALQEPALIETLIDKLVHVSADYLSLQVEAGADVLQLFDSWAGVLSEREYAKWVIAPTKKLVSLVREKHPEVPIIGFPRCSGVLYEDYAKRAGVDAVGIDYQTPLAAAFTSISKPLQGNLDPLLLATDREKAIAETKHILEVAHGKPFIFNLGHGILPETPIANVTAVCEAIRATHS